MSGPFAGLTPQGLYTRRIMPGDVVSAVDPDALPVRLTIAAVDPHAAVDKKNKPSTLRLVPRTVIGNESESEEDEEEDEEDEEDDEKDKDGSDDPVVLCTLAPGVQFQQPLDLTIFPEEGPLFQVVGSFPIDVSGNFIGFPEGDDDDYDSDEDSEDDEDYDGAESGSGSDSGSGSEEDELDGADYDLTPDEDELQNRITEITEKGGPAPESESEDEAPKEQQKPKDKKNKKDKRPAEEPAKAPDAKKAKKVEFAEKLEKPASATESKYPTKKLDGGVVIEDHKIGKGPQAKRGQKIGMRYIGKLKTGKVFDKNTSGKPFVFTLGAGDVIRGWDVGVAGMAVGGERRIIIPAAMAYGKASLPGIPANSELQFDVKLVNIK